MPNIHTHPYGVESQIPKENFFVRYALRGPIVVRSLGLRQGLPRDTPLSGPVREPSPLNNRYLWNPAPPPLTGII